MCAGCLLVVLFCVRVCLRVFIFSLDLFAGVLVIDLVR